MKMLSFLAITAATVAISFTTVQASSLYANQAKNPADGTKTIVYVCGDDPDGHHRCVLTTYDDGSNCLIIDNEGAPGGIWFSGECYM